MKFFSKRNDSQQKNIESNVESEENFEQIDSSELAGGSVKDLPKSRVNHKKGVTKVVKCIVLGTLTTAIGCVIARTVFISNKSYFKNSDLITEVSEELNSDMDIMQYEQFNNQIVRLKPNDDGKVSVFIENNVPERTKQNIQESLDYFNDIFDDVNDKFNFTIVDKPDYVADSIIQKSTIKFDYKVLDDDVYGLNTHNMAMFGLPVRIFSENENDGKYCVSSSISLNKSYFDQIDDKMQQYTIRHEMLHSLGFDDVYGENYTEFATIMNTENFYILNELSPSDMRRLYTAYCDYYINDDKTINYEKLEEVKNNLREYDAKYYEDLAQVLKASFKGECYNISNKELKNFSASYGLLDVKINSDGGYEYVYNKNSKNPNTYFAGKGTVVKGKDYAFIPQIDVFGVTKYYVILKDSNGLNMYDIYVDKTPIREKTSYKANIVLKPGIANNSQEYSDEYSAQME